MQMLTGPDYIKPYQQKLSEEQLRHLLRRTMFGFNDKDLDFFKNRSAEECMKVLLVQDPVPGPVRNYFFDDDKAVPEGEPIVSAPKGEVPAEQYRCINLKAWWFRLMLNQPRTVSEKMTLFWHNHFAVQFKMVGDSRYAYRYLDLLHKNALGNFKKLLRQITTDACMLVYLNGNENNKASPNENYARELQELFAVGKGAGSGYTEDDVKAAAKVLSGWKEDKEKIITYFNPEAHNTEDKTFSSFYHGYTIKGKAGEEGAKETDELIQMICRQKEVSRFMCRKLYRWFMDSNIDEDIENNFIAPLADIMIKADYEMIPVLKAMFGSSLFFEKRFIGAMIKSHVDYTCQVLKGFNVEFPTDPTNLGYKTVPFIFWFTQVGQDMGDPPSVAGWPAYYESPRYYKNWIDSETLSQRMKMTKYLTFPEDPKGTKFDFLSFVGGLSAPDNAQVVIEESASMFFGLTPATAQLAFLEKMLANENGTAEAWDVLWKKYKANTEDKEAGDKAEARLKKLYDVFFNFPEFQLM